MKAGGGVQQLLGTNPGFQQFPGLLKVIGPHLAENFKAKAGVSGHSTQNGAGIDALHVAGGRDDNALGILDDIPAACGPDFLGHDSERLPGFGGGQRNGDRLGASQGGNQLLLKDADIGFVSAFFQHFLHS